MLMIVVISLSESGITSKYEMMKYVLCIFPPASTIATCFYGLDYFTVGSMLWASLHGVIYSGIILIAGVFIVDKRDF